MKRVTLTDTTKKLMGIKETAVFNEQQMYQAEGDFAEVFGFLDGLYNTGKQVETKTITDLYKVMKSMENGGTYDAIPEMARLIDSVKFAMLFVEQSKDYTLEIANKYGINI